MRKKDLSSDLGLGDLLRGLGDLLEVAQKLDSRGCNEINNTGVFGSADPSGLKGTYGFRVKVGGLDGPLFQPFGNLRTGEGKVECKDTWEPILDVFDEDDRILVVAELPGVEEDQLLLEITGGYLELKASGVRQYRKSIPLPCVVDEKNIISVSKNGIVEITLFKK